MTPLVLLSVAVLLAGAGPRLLLRPWADRAPGLAVAAWLWLAATAVVATSLAGLALVVPLSDVAGGLAALLHACRLAVHLAYATVSPLPLLGVGLAVAVPAWTAGWLAVGLLEAAARRRGVRRRVTSVGRLDPTTGAMIVDSPQASAYCLAGRRSCVVVTSAALAALTPLELSAVLAHESAHLRGRHHLLVGAADALARALPWAPLFRRGAQEVRRLVELLADDAATREVPAVELASALLRLAGMRTPAVALAAAVTAGAVRVQRLLQAPRPLPLSLRFIAMAALALLAVAPVGIAAQPGLSAAADGVCPVPSLTVVL